MNVTLLDDFLHALPSCGAAPDDGGGDDAPAASDPEAPDAALEDRHDLVLRASADLFRDSPALLENALSLLEGQERHQSGGGEGGGQPAIRRIRARRSGREAVLVRSGGQRRRGRAGGDGGGDDGEGGRGYYLCLLGDGRADGRSLLTDGESRVRRPLHCTCRSYLQNTMTGGGRGVPPAATAAAPDPCKHLLASILMPHLLPWSRRSEVAEVVDDKEFARLMLAASIG